METRIRIRMDQNEDCLLKNFLEEAAFLTPVLDFVNDTLVRVSLNCVLCSPYLIDSGQATSPWFGLTFPIQSKTS